MPPFEEHHNRKFVVLTREVAGGQELLLNYGEGYWEMTKEEARTADVGSYELTQREEIQRRTPKTMIRRAKRLLGECESKLEADDAEELLAELVATITEPAVKLQVSRLAAVLQAAEQLAEQQMRQLAAQ
jgi:hypothetical protein